MDDFLHSSRERSEAYSVTEFCTRMWQQRRTMIGCGLLFAGLTAAYFLLALKPYMAEALIRIDTDPSARVETVSLDSEIDFIRSRSMVQMALDRLGPSVDIRAHRPSLLGQLHDLLGLPRDHIFSSLQPGFRIEKLKVPDRLLNEKLTLKIEAGNHYTLFDAQDRLLFSDVLPNEPEAPASATDTLAPTPIQLIVRDIRAPVGSSYTLIPRSTKNVITELQRQLKAEPLDRKDHAGFMHVSFASDHAVFAKRFLNALVDSYVKRTYDYSARDKLQALERFNAQLKTIKTQLETAEANLKEFEQRSGTVDMTAEMQFSLQQLMDVETQIRTIKAKQRELGAYYTALHPSQQSLSDQLSFLVSELARKQAEVDSLPEIQRQLLQYNREVETYKQIYDLTAQKRTELSNDAASIAGYAKIIDPPEILDRSAALRFIKAVSAGFVLGFCFGAMFVYTAYLSPIASVRTVQQITAMTPLPILATLPRVTAAKSSRRRRRKRVMPLLSGDHIDNKLFGDFFVLLKNLGFAAFNASNPLLMITGTSAGHAPAVIAANTAALYAKINKTLLIDCGMRERGLHSYLRTTHEPGLSDVIIGKSPLDVAVRPLDKNLYFLPGGTPTSYGTHLLSQEIFIEMLKEFTKTFRYVVLYSPAITADQLNSTLMQYVGSIALVVSAGEKLEPLQHFLAAFARHPNAKGIILDDVQGG